MVRVSFFALFAVCQLAFACACTPAVIWCSHDSSDYDAMYRTVPSSPLQKLTPDEFEKSLLQLNVTEPAVVVEELCVEDLRNSKVLSNATNGSKIFYFPCVVSPDEIFQKIYKQKKMIEDINDDHDHEFNMILKDIDSSGCIALTGKQCRYSYTERIKREALADNSTSEFKIKTDNVLLYSAQPLILKISDKPEVQLVQSKVSGMSSRKSNESTVILTIKLTDQTIGSLTLEFFFEVKSAGYYTLNKVTYETTNGVDNLFTKRDIYFPFGFSYHCSPKTTFTDGTTFLSITDMQVQVDHKDATFSDAYDCVGFTSIPIWTGIFVTIILGLIMIWALTMIMDIRTMDRFDDPKGKTITISSAE
ncbi:VAS1 ATPase, partial [Acromyrmex charruanus]